MAQAVAHLIGSEEVTGSNPVSSLDPRKFTVNFRGFLRNMQKGTLLFGIMPKRSVPFGIFPIEIKEEIIYNHVIIIK